MATRCKVKCLMTRESVAQVDGKAQTVQEAQFTAVSGGSDENKQFFAYTPALSLSVAVIKVPTFESGKEYYLDFTEVPSA